VPSGTGRAFEAARRERRGAFIAYLASGFPDAAESERLALALCEEGADVVELGVPFSDPVADGPVIQRATQIALERGATLAGTLRAAASIRRRHDTPIVIMSYLNPIHRYGAARFARDAASAGVDGVILVDLPPEEDPETWEAVLAAGLDTIALATPTTASARLPVIAARARGFLYVVARLGVTGGGSVDPAVLGLLDRCRELSPLPRCLGFGMGLSSDLSIYRGKAEGVIVGSGLLEPLLGLDRPADREASVRRFARAFRERTADLWESRGASPAAGPAAR
jgi:tryptophan synthase alpha chain